MKFFFQRDVAFHFLIWSFLGLLSGSLQAGSLRVFVHTKTGEPVKDATVLVTENNFRGKKVKKTSAEGMAVFEFIRVGTGKVQALLTSLSSTPQGFSIQTDREVSIRLILKNEEEEITSPKKINDEDALENKTRVLDTTEFASGGILPPEMLNRLASDRTLTSLMRFFPGVVESSIFKNGLLINGGSPYANQLFIDGVRMTDPVSGSIEVPLNVDSIAELRLLSAGLDAEYGFLNGGRIDLTTREGADEFHVDGSAWVAPAELALLDEGEASLQSRAEANLLVTGPILRKKLWFLTSASLKDVNAATPFSPQSFQKPGQEMSTRGVHLLGKLIFQPADWQRFSLVINGDPQWAANILQDELIDKSAERQRFSGGMAAGLLSKTRLAEGIFWSSSLGYRASRVELSPQSGNLDLPSHINIETGGTSENDRFYSRDFRHRVEVNSKLSVRVPKFLGRHLIKVGAEALLNWNVYAQNQTGGRAYFDDADGNPQEVAIVHNQGEQWLWGNQGSLFIQDRWQPISSVTVRAGLRFDSSRAYTANNNMGLELFNFNTISPRLGLSWDPFDDGNIVLRGGYFHYVDTGRLDLAHSVGQARITDVYAYNDATSEYDVFVEQKTEGRNLVFSPGMQAPGIHEFILGSRFVAFSDAVLGADIIYRRREKSFEDRGVNLLWNETGSDVLGYSDGSNAPIFELGTFDAAYSDYFAAVFLFQKRVAKDWTLMFNYTFSSLTGTNEGAPSSALDNSKQAAFEVGPLADDIRHNAQLHATYDFPLGVSVGISLMYLSGRPISKRFYNAAFNNYTDLRAPRGTDPVSLLDPNDDEEIRLADQLKANVRLIWRLDKLTGQDIWLTLDVFNLFNQRSVLEVEERNLPVTANTRFMTSLRKSLPLRAQASLRFRF